ncbi:MAG: hypothetical protein VX738_03615 [Planctomycetota bacterium]|nr:hypothetical protein [Planctomycetota bacterium]
MPIPVTCQCGYKVNAPDQYAGQQVPCPTCNQPLQIPHPQPSPIDSDLQEMLGDAGITAVTPGGIRCPNCMGSVPAGGIICMECGFNVTSGELMGIDSQKDTREFGGAVYTQRSYGNKQLDKAAQDMEVELFEGDKSNSPTPYWVWLFIFLNVISFGMGLALFSLTYFSLSGETIRIALYQGQAFSSLGEDANLDNYHLVVSETDLSSEPGKSSANTDEMGMDFSIAIAPGTYCTVSDEQNGYSYIVPVSGQNNQESGWIPTMAVIPMKASQIKMLKNGGNFDAPANLRPISDNADYAFYSGLGTYTAIQFWLGVIFYAIAHVSIAIWSFKDQMVHALLATLVPVYNIVWCFMRWKYVGGYGIMAILGLLMIIGSLIASLFVPELLPTVAGSADIR